MSSVVCYRCTGAAHRLVCRFRATFIRWQLRLSLKMLQFAWHCCLHRVMVSPVSSKVHQPFAADCVCIKVVPVVPVSLSFVRVPAHPDIPGKRAVKWHACKGSPYSIQTLGQSWSRSLESQPTGDYRVRPKKCTTTKIWFSLKRIGNLRRNFQHLSGTYMPIFR